MVSRRASNYYLCCALLMSPFFWTKFERSGGVYSAAASLTVLITDIDRQSEKSVGKRVEGSDPLCERPLRTKQPTAM
jgi:hypothetical protein